MHMCLRCLFKWLYDQCYSNLGYGGGFKENDNVTYREREDSDGEFDDVNGFDLVLLQIYAWLLQISFLGN